MLGGLTLGPLSQYALAFGIMSLAIRYVVNKQFEDEDRAFEQTYQNCMAEMNRRNGNVNQKTTRKRPWFGLGLYN